jgi:hypothetical protein
MRAYNRIKTERFKDHSDKIISKVKVGIEKYCLNLVRSSAVMFLFFIILSFILFALK